MFGMKSLKLHLFTGNIAMTKKIKFHWFFCFCSSQSVFCSLRPAGQTYQLQLSPFIFSKWKDHCSYALNLSSWDNIAWEKFRLELDYFRKQICLHALKLLNEKESESVKKFQISSLTEDTELYFHGTKKSSLNTLKNNNIKSSKRKLVLKCKSCTSSQNKWKPLSRLMKTNPRRRCSLGS